MKTANKKKRVLVAMSGGVDSSVALIKVLEMGYEAIGITLKLWEKKDKKTNKIIDSDCNSLDAVNGAKLVCDRLGVHHYTLNFIDLFRTEVVNNFSNEYFSGRTPTPILGDLPKKCLSCTHGHFLLRSSSI